MITNKLYIDVRPDAACDYHRVVMPVQHLPQLKLNNPILWFNRFSSKGLEFLKKMQSQGVKIVVDVDDYHVLTNEHPFFQNWIRSGMAFQIESTLKLADLVTCSTSLLASKILHLNQNIEVVPNALPFDQGQFVLSKDRMSSTKYVYAAGSSHLHDISILPHTETITLAGYYDCPEWKNIRNIHKAFPIARGKPLCDYMSLYNGHKASLAPLQDSEFNSCKSNLKLLEAGAKGIPLIASRVRPYYNELDKRVVIFPEDWKKTLKQMTSKSLKEAGQATAEHVRTHYHLTDANEKRRQIFESL